MGDGGQTPFSVISFTVYVQNKYLLKIQISSLVRSKEVFACRSMLFLSLSFPGGSEGKESACNAGDPGSNPGLERSLGEGNDNLPQYSCLENCMDRGVWWATVHGVTKSQTRLSN